MHVEFTAELREMKSLRSRLKLVIEQLQKMDLELEALDKRLVSLKEKSEMDELELEGYRRDSGLSI